MISSILHDALIEICPQPRSGARGATHALDDPAQPRSFRQVHLAQLVPELRHRCGTDKDRQLRVHTHEFRIDAAGSHVVQDPGAEVISSESVLVLRGS